MHEGILMKTIFFLFCFLGPAVIPTGAMAESHETLTIGINGEFENLNPMIGSELVTFYLLYAAWRPLVGLSPDGKWTPLLIKKIPSIENKMAKKKGNGLEVTIEFVNGAKWGDGVSMTCRDLEFSWRIGKNKNVSIPNREMYDNINSITWDPKSDQKCILNFSQNKYDFVVNMPDPMPAHLEEPIYNKYKDQPQGYDVNSAYTKAPATPGLYNGPYVITEVKLGSHVILEPNPYFFGRKPQFKKVIFKLIPNNISLVPNLRSGSIDLISPTGWGLDQAVAFEKNVKNENLPYEVVFQDGFVYGHIDLNLDNSILSDIRVRKALSFGLNKKEMVQTLTEGKGKVADQFVADIDPWKNPKVANYDYNKNKANHLLDEAGWRLQPNGLRQKDGKNLSLTLMGAAGVKIVELMQTYIQGQYKSLGIELKIKNEPPRVLFGQTIIHRAYEMALFSWTSMPENSPRTILHSTSIPSEKNSYAGQNYTGYSNPKVDHLIDQLESELSVKKRTEIAQKILAAYSEDIPVMPIYFRPNNAVIPKGMKGFRLAGSKFAETLEIENWRW